MITDKSGKRKFFPLLLFFLLIFLAGCIQEDIRIVLRADGSGEYHIKRVMSQIENIFTANVRAISHKKDLTEQENIPKEYPGGLRRISYTLRPNPDDPGKFTESSVYTFPNLGEALPALENIVDMGPRYAYRDGRFVIFLNREKSDLDGFSSTEVMKDAYFNLTIELPVKPLSSNGTVEGKKVSWHFDTDDLKKFQEMEIGTNLIHASIPASAIKVDIVPRLVEEKKRKKKKEKEFEPLNLFSARFPILGNTSKEVKANLEVFFHVDEFNLPISYKDLKIESMVVEGKAVEPELKTELTGVFNGKNQLGQEVPGFPLKLEFPTTNPWIEKIDLLKIKMKINVVGKTQRNIIEITSKKYPRLVTPKDPNPLLSKIAVAKVKLGSASAMLPTPSIMLLTTAEPGTISTFFLDTDYGLRYKAKSVKSQKKKRNDFWDAKLRTFVEKTFSKQEQIYAYVVEFAKMPSPPFTLIMETIMNQNFQSRTLILENIDVSP